MKIKLLSERALIPHKGSSNSAGYDLRSPEDYTVLPKYRLLIWTKLAIEFPSGCYGRIAPRSGLSLDKCIDIGAGVIDPDYQGEIGVLLINNSSVPFYVKRSDRIAQLILEKYINAKMNIVLKFDKQTERGCTGFGSTGM